jgi:quercetin dioxygenase-like cupin family protein
MSFFDISKLPVQEMSPGTDVRLIHSDNMTISFWNITAGTIVPPHQHVHESVLILLEGRLKMTIGEETMVLESGMSAFVPSNVTHHAEIGTNCRMIDIFYPVRKEFTKAGRKDS